MDDLKLHSSNNDDLEDVLSIVKWFNDDRGIQFGVDKCAKVTFTKSALSFVLMAYQTLYVI